MMAHVCNPGTWEVEANCHEFEASLGYMVNTRSACATQQDCISKQTNKQNKNKTIETIGKI